MIWNGPGARTECLTRRRPPSDRDPSIAVPLSCTANEHATGTANENREKAVTMITFLDHHDGLRGIAQPRLSSTLIGPRAK